MKAGLDDLAEEAVRLPDLDEVVARDAVARVRERLVVGPGAAAQVEERAERAVAVDDDVGEVDGPAGVALALEHRRGDRHGRRDALALELHVGEAADEADLVLVLRAGLVVGLDDSSVSTPRRRPTSSVTASYTGMMLGARKVPKRSRSVAGGAALTA